MDLSASSIGALGTKYKFPLEAVGFVMGVTAADAAYNAGGYTIENRLKDFISHLGISGVEIGGAKTSNRFNPDIGKVFNNGTYVYLALELFGDMLPSEIRSISHLIKPLALGYGVGKILDPAPVPVMMSAGNQVTYGTMAGF